MSLDFRMSIEVLASIDAEVLNQRYYIPVYVAYLKYSSSIW